MSAPEAAESGVGIVVHAEPERCVGASQCVLWAPEVFDQNDDGIVVVLDERPAASLRGSVDSAVTSCPARAITYELRD